MDYVYYRYGATKLKTGSRGGAKNGGGGLHSHTLIRPLPKPGDDAVSCFSNNL